MYPSNAKKIRSKLGDLYEEIINKRSMVVGKSLHVKVEIVIDTHLQVDFFFQKGNEEELWIFFKYDRLVDVCFRCGLLSYIIGRALSKNLQKLHLRMALQLNFIGYSCEPLVKSSFVF